MHTERYACPADVLDALPSRRAGGRRRHHGGAGARVGAATGRARRAAPSCSSTATRVPRWSTRCSPTSTCPARRCSCWSTRSSGPAGGGSTTTALRRGLPLPLLRRRHAARPPVGPGRVKLTVDVEAHRRRGPGRARSPPPRGTFATPCFMPVGTRGAVRTLSSADLEDLGVEVVLGNTYHLMLRPGADVVATLGGLHGFMAWPGHVLTDSRRLPDLLARARRSTTTGVTFRSTYDGSTAPPHARGRGRASRSSSAPTSRWCSTCARRCPSPRRSCAPRSTAPRRGPSGPAPRSRRRDPDRPRPSRPSSASCRAASTLALRGRERRSGRSRSASTATRSAGCRWARAAAEMLAGPGRHRRPSCPADQPRYLMGVGDPVGLVEAVGARRRPVRLRAAHPPRPATARSSPTPGGSTCATPATRPTTARSTRPAPARSAPAGRGPTCATCCWSASPRRGPAASPSTTWPGPRASWPGRPTRSAPGTFDALAGRGRSTSGADGGRA